jgi:hypothetical protein
MAEIGIVIDATFVGHSGAVNTYEQIGVGCRVRGLQLSEIRERAGWTAVNSDEREAAAETPSRGPAQASLRGWADKAPARLCAGTCGRSSVASSLCRDPGRSQARCV